VSVENRRVLAIGLDAFEISLVEPMIAEGRLPNIKRLRERSARFQLDHKRAKYTGLAWEHFSTGQSPEEQKRWSAVTFDRRTYSVDQPVTGNRPFVADLPGKTVVFDAPYFDLRHAPNALGITSWGAHDPGTEALSNPAILRDELLARFGDYPAPEWIYGFSWPSSAKTKAAGEALARATNVRSAAARWLLAERLPDWQLAIVVVSESHSAIEQFWHGVDRSHLLHGIPSAPTFRDATVVMFAMHGMGENKSDLTAMLLVPELLYRHAFGRPYAKQRIWPGHLADGTPLFEENDEWESAMQQVVPWPNAPGAILARLRRRLLGDQLAIPGRDRAGNLGWMPASRYSAFWPSMRAFALPAYYDSWVRVNVEGREANGLVSPADYERTRREIVDLIAACRDPISGREVLETVVLPDKPLAEVGSTEADIYLSFAARTIGFKHPTLGTIGPLPYRRTGGHTGDWGFLYVAGRAAQPGERGTADAFDVVPTVIALLGAPDRPDLSGTSLLPRLS
jgi:hypothetical protein